ncbi:MAG: hypothetical protein NT007_11625 [Candidatus Kapabacteria bacterium]|nr:hypothetical protein [Candidatus Kapabacteria bacterium]
MINIYTNSAKSINLLIAIIFFLIIFRDESAAIPAFARKYKTACATCHIAITKRNAVGEAFRRNGYNLPSQLQSWVKDPPLKLGADSWKDIWPDGIWPSSIPGTVPIAIYAAFGLQNNFRKVDNPKLIVDMPADLGLIFAGTFGEDISFFGSWSSEYGSNRMFLRFNDLFSLGNYFNLKVGKFEPGINDSYPGNQKITLANTNLQDYAAAGDWAARKSHSGFELNGFLNHSVNYQVGLVNSIGYSDNDSFDKFDYYGRVGFKLGGIFLDGFDRLRDSSQTYISEYNSLMMGFFTYYGNSLKFDTSKKSYNNNFKRFGADLKYSYNKFDFLAGGMFGSDLKPDTSYKKLSSLVYFGEINYNFYPWLIGVLRLEHIQSKFETNDKDIISNLIPNLTMLVRQNFRLSFEGCFQYHHDKNVNGSIIIADKREIFKNFRIFALIAF